MDIRRDVTEETTCICLAVPAELKAAIVERVEAQASSVNDVIVAMLARRYGIEFVPAGGRGQPSLAALHILVRLPRSLKRALQWAALNQGTNMTDLIARALADELEVDIRLSRPRRTSPFGGGARQR